MTDLESLKTKALYVLKYGSHYEDSMQFTYNKDNCL